MENHRNKEPVDRKATSVDGCEVYQSRCGENSFPTEKNRFDAIPNTTQTVFQRQCFDFPLPACYDFHIIRFFPAVGLIAIIFRLGMVS
jgi:hypothetical protein